MRYYQGIRVASACWLIALASTLCSPASADTPPAEHLYPPGSTASHAKKGPALDLADFGETTDTKSRVERIYNTGNYCSAVIDALVQRNAVGTLQVFGNFLATSTLGNTPETPVITLQGSGARAWSVRTFVVPLRHATTLFVVTWHRPVRFVAHQAQLFVYLTPIRCGANIKPLPSAVR